MATETDLYTLTERAGSRVAGHVVGDRTEIPLTPAEAEYELREGTIVPKGKSLSKGFTEPSKAADRQRAEAAAAKDAAIPAGAGQGGGTEPAGAGGKPAGAGGKPAGAGGKPA